MSHTKEDLNNLVAKSLEEKIQISTSRIIEWYENWGGQVYVAFSGGKDSTVLLDLVRKVYPDVPALFVNTGLEYPELQSSVRNVDNVIITRPKMMFNDVVTTYGYPLISKEVSEAIYYARRIRVGQDNTTEMGRVARRTNRLETDWKRLELIGDRPNCSRAEWRGALSVRRQSLMGEFMMPNSGGVFSPAKSQFNKEKWLPLCYLPIPISNYCCNVMKKKPSHDYEHKTNCKPFIGTLTEESRVRKQAWLKSGCNAFDSANPKSQPLSFWTEQDILQYIRLNNLSIPSVYGDIVENEKGLLTTTGIDRTGCMFCCYGLHLEKGETRFQKLAKTHPKQYEYCLGGGQWIDNPDYVPDAPEYDGEWKNWNPKKIWTPSKDGLGMKVMFDMVNDVYGKDFYRYE